MIEILKMLKNDLMTVSQDEEIRNTLNIIDVVDSHERYTTRFKRALLLLDKTIANDDEIAIQCALSRVRVAAMNLSNNYNDIMYDVGVVDRDPSRQPIPEGYQLPKIYNDYLIKNN